MTEQHVHVTLTSIHCQSTEQEMFNSLITIPLSDKISENHNLPKPVMLILNSFHQLTHSILSFMLRP